MSPMYGALYICIQSNQKVSTALFHTVAVTASGDVIGCGQNDEGQVRSDLPAESFLPRPSLLEPLMSHRVIQVRLKKIGGLRGKGRAGRSFLRVEAAVALAGLGVCVCICVHVSDHGKRLHMRWEYCSRIVLVILVMKRTLLLELYRKEHRRRCSCFPCTHL